MVTVSPLVDHSWWEKNEIPRKVLHGSIAFITTALYFNGVQFSDIVPVLLSMLAPITTLEFIRFRFSSFNRAYIAVVGFLMREAEKERNVNGVIWYLVGLSTVMSIFSKDVALLSVYLLSWSDLAASTVGRAYGSRTIKLVGNKSLAGFVAAFITGVFSTFFVYDGLLSLRPECNSPSMILYNRNLSSLPMLGLAVVMGFAAAIAELFPIVDDNLSIPIVCACVHYVVVKLTTLPYSYGVLE